jgi:hypothetical protein
MFIAFENTTARLLPEPGRSAGNNSGGLGVEQRDEDGSTFAES